MKEDNEEFEDILGGPEHEEPSDHSLDRLEDSLTSEIENRTPRELEVKEVQVIGVYEHQEEGAPAGLHPPAFVLLRDNQGRQVIIWIGYAEAFAISLALEHKTPKRPLTHDLMKNLADRLGCTIEQVLIDDLWKETYYAKLAVAINGKTLEIDARPSDAIALALRAKAPIYMAEYVLERAAITEET